MFFWLCPLHSNCIILFHSNNTKKLLVLHYRYSLIVHPMPHFLHVHYLCDYCFYEWSLSSLDRGSFQVLNRKRDEDGLGDSLSKHLPPTYIITFPLVEIKPSKQFWQGHPIYKKLIQLDLVNGLVQPVSGLIQLGLEQKRVNSKWSLKPITLIWSFTNRIYLYLFYLQK